MSAERTIGNQAFINRLARENLNKEVVASPTRALVLKDVVISTGPKNSLVSSSILRRI